MSTAMGWMPHFGVGSMAGGGGARVVAAAGGSRVPMPVFSTASKNLPLFALVRLVRPLATDEEFLPAESVGTIVAILARGKAYVVEVFHPRHAVVTVHDDALAAHSA